MSKRSKYQNDLKTKILTFPSSSFLRRIDGTDPPFNINLPASPALYWPRLTKQSNSKLLAHTNRYLPTLAGRLLSYMKSIHNIQINIIYYIILLIRIII